MRLLRKVCKWGTDIEVMVKIPADLSSTHQNKWKREKIDSCIADLVRALQEGGIDMRGSCCGHEKYVGHINLQDGRVLIITDVRGSEILLDEIEKDYGIVE